MSKAKAHDAAEKTKGKSKKSSASSRKPKDTAARDAEGKFTARNAHTWKPGQSGNPAGRPKCITLSEAYRKALAQVCPEDPDGRTYAEVIAEKQVKIAASDNYFHSPAVSTNAAKEICDRTEGKARQPIDIDAKQDVLKQLAAFLGVSVDQLPKPGALQ